MVVMACLVAQISMGALHPLASFLATGRNEFYCFCYQTHTQEKCKSAHYWMVYIIQRHPIQIFNEIIRVVLQTKL